MAESEADTTESSPPRFHRNPIVAAGCLFVITELILGTGLGGQHVEDRFAYLIQLVAGIFATYYCARTWRKLGGIQGIAWACIGGIALVQTAGVIVDGVVDTVLTKPPLAITGAALSAAAAIPLALAGAGFMLAARFDLSKLRAMLDGLIVFLSVFLVAWTVVLAHLVFKTLHPGTANILDAVALLASPSADAVYVIGAFILVVQSQKAERRGFLFLVLALGFNQFADLASGVASSHHEGQWFAAMWLGAYLSIGLGAMHAGAATKRIEPADWAERSSMLPYVAVAAAAIAMVLEPMTSRQLAERESTLDPVLAGTGILMLAILAVRQTISLQENRRLARDLRDQADALRGSEARFRSLVQNSSDAIVVLDRDGKITYVTPSADSLFGTPYGELIGAPLVSIIHADDQMALADHLAHIHDIDRNWAWISFRTRGSWGQDRFLEAVPTNMLKDPNVRGIVLNVRDVTDRRKLEEQLRHQAFHDPLTMLANRALFHDRVGRALLHVSRQDEVIAVLFVDLDDFKNINDTLGHAVGDRLLAEVGQRIAGALRTMDTAARLGGDEFAVLLERGVGEADAIGVARRVLEAIREPMVVEETPLSISASIGIALGDSRYSADDLLRRADVAMYQAKGSGKGGYAIFDDSMDLLAVARLQFEVEMHHALVGGQLVAYYQPIIDTNTGRIDGVEALVRWQHPTRGLLPPSEFVELAEETGQIVALGQNMLRIACEEAVRWERPDGGHPYVSVNISSKHFQNQTLVDEVIHALSLSGLGGERLVIEVTETGLLADVAESRRQMEKLRQMHVRVALDDFGTGYSSLGYLRELPVDVLKIDRSFVSDLGNSQQPADFLKAIHTLSTSLQLDTIAEGVEDYVQLGALRSMGIRRAQGFLFSKPVPADTVNELISRGGFKLDATPLEVARSA